MLRDVAPRLGLEAAIGDFGATVYDLAFAFPAHAADARERHRRSHWARPG